MKRPTFNENTEVKVVDKTSSMYGWRGVVKQLGVSIGDGPRLNPTLDKEAIVAAYQNGREPYMKWYAWVRFPEMGMELWLEAAQLEAIQHKFIDIDYLREEAIVLGTKPDGTQHVRSTNSGAFEVGDIIQISTKIDGANASVAWDETAGKLEVFSRTNLLDSPGALHGFYDYIKTEIEPKADWSLCPDLVIFGEWCVSHTCKYDKSWYNKWRVYDIWSKYLNCYLPQSAVKKFCETRGLEYIEELYYGPFISWEHCRSFIGKSTIYGPQQEGIVVKNQTKLLDSYGVKDPIYIKIVDEKFKEAQHSNKPPKVVDPEKVAAYEKAVELIEAVVTEARVKKAICKMIDEGQLPSELQPKDMGSVMKLLPKAMFDDIVKEENETVKAVQDLGENLGKLVASTAAKHARAIVVGQK